jgi:hypothetical protein
MNRHKQLRRILYPQEIDMPSNGTRARANDSMHILIDTEDDLLKPINENRTNPNLENPFVLEHNIRLARKNEEHVDGTTGIKNV